MQRYIFQRLLFSVPTFIGITFIIFLLVRLLPGDVIDQMTAEYGATVGQREELERKLGLDKPAWEQYVRWVGNLLTGDFGRSLRSNQPITEELSRRLPPTIELGALAMVVTLVVAIPTGIVAALTQDRLPDYLLRSFAVLALAIPSFWLGIMAITLGALWFGWVPPVRYRQLWDAPGTNLEIMMLPALFLGLYGVATVMRLMRTQLLEVLRQDFIRTARAKGLNERSVVVRHGLRNALLPVVTTIGFLVPIYFGGTVVLESIFSIPGIGRLLIEAVGQRDYPVIQALNVIFALIVIFTNLLVDLSYTFIDPRVRQR